MKKALFFDIDGTLWDKRQQIPESTRDAFIQLQEKGHHLFICSGRTRVMIPDEQLMPLGFHGVLAGCGTYGEFQRELKYYHKIEAKQLKKDIAFLKSIKASYILEGRHALYLDEEVFPEGDQFPVEVRKAVGDKLLRVSGNEEQIEASKLCVNYMDKFQQELEQEIGINYDIIHRDGHFMEIVPKGFSKATGIREICSILGIAHEDTYAFGDSTNDLEMLEFAAHSVAMGDGMQEAKDAAEYVTTALWQDGIYNGLKYYDLI